MGQKRIAATPTQGSALRVILGKAGWHTTRKLRPPSNLILVPLPPACPELNAAENIWQYLRQTYLANRVFNDYIAILDGCQDAWRKLLAETGRITSIAQRDWIIGQSLRRLLLNEDELAVAFQLSGSTIAIPASASLRATAQIWQTCKHSTLTRDVCGYDLSAHGLKCLAVRHLNTANHMPDLR